VAAATRSIATVLFTDIVGSTERAMALGYRRWHQARSDHGRAPFVSSRSHATSATS
jgi:class 3 adenylate cyclase